MAAIHPMTPAVSAAMRHQTSWTKTTSPGSEDTHRFKEIPAGYVSTFRGDFRSGYGNVLEVVLHFYPFCIYLGKLYPIFVKLLLITRSFGAHRTTFAGNFLRNWRLHHMNAQTIAITAHTAVMTSETTKVTRSTAASSPMRSMLAAAF